MKRKVPTAAEAAKRMARLAPNGVPRWIRCYDNGGESGDRYTAVFTGAACVRACGGEYPYRAMSGDPFHPQGIGLWCSDRNRPVDCYGKDGRYAWPPAVGRKCRLGRRIRYEDLPADCRKLVMSDYMDVWNLRAGHYYGEPAGRAE